MNHKRILFLFTRTQLHVGAGSSVGAIDQPIIRERHTAFPIIPASSLKGTFADEWSDGLLQEGSGSKKKVRVKKDGTTTACAWLFGSDNDKHAAAGCVQFTEARLLAFPIRSARGSFAWITCPLMLQRAVRDGVLPGDLLNGLPEPADDQAVFNTDAGSELDISGKIVLEEYTFTSKSWPGLARLGEHLASKLQDPVWSEVKRRLVVLSNGMMSFFAQNSCEIAQHVRINDETGTADDGALFNQENVPSETLFYALTHFQPGRGSHSGKTSSDAEAEFRQRVAGRILQFGGDASTGLGYCIAVLDESREEVAK